MTAWLKMETPPAGPPTPPEVDHQALMGALGAKAAPGGGGLSPAEQYLQAKAPAGQVDKWGEPFPLSTVEQERLDRLVAILVSPFDRGRALLKAGQLIHDEVEAIRAGYPEIYAMLVERAVQDMTAHPPPYPVWAETALAVLFGMPAEQVWQASTAPRRQPDMSKPAGGGGAPQDAEPPTASQRREIPVRELRS